MTISWRPRTRWRWLVMLAAVAVLVALPGLVQALPAPTASVSATTLLTRIQHSGGVAYSGYAEADGGLDLPVTNQFTGIADLFGGHTQLRVWWRGSHDWRVDSIGYTGETDLHMTDQGWWTWNYESNTATFSQQTADPRVRLPNDSDVLPPPLTRRLLSEARPDEVSSIASARVAGENAAGLRVRPDEPNSTVDHIDVWADTATGLPLRVVVHGKGSASPAMSSSFLDVSVGMPAAATTRFELPPRVTVESGGAQDLASALDSLGATTLPGTLAGIARNPELPGVGTVGIYGRGVTEFAVVPLPRRIAFTLRDELSKVADTGTKNDPGQLAVSSGPLNLLISSFDAPAGPWLLIGTVTASTLTAAAQTLPDRPRIGR